MMDFLVRKRQLETFKFSIKFDPNYGVLAPGEVLFELKSFGLSRTNIAYAQHGDAAGFWGLFPSERGWGSLPCWGIAEIVRSRNARIAEGETFYGCYPISMRAVARLSGGRRPNVVEATAPQRNLPLAFSEYRRISDRACSDARSEAMHILFRPAFDAAVLIRDFLRSHNYFAADSIIVTNAESKTALCLAFLLTKETSKRFALIGLTSGENRNVPHGSFDQTLRQSELARLACGRPTIVIDLTDRVSLLAKLQDHLAGNVVCICKFGHGGSSPGHSTEANGATEFSTESLLSVRRSEPAPQVDEAWAAFVNVTCTSIDPRRHSGYMRIAQIYLELLTGRSKSQCGYILTW